jgi:hypothetical protein
LISFGITYWPALLIAFIVASIGISLLLYFRNKANSELTKTQQRILMTLRFLSFFLIAFLLLSPFIRNLKKITQNPFIVVAFDNSSSMTMGDDSTELANSISDTKDEIISELSGNFEVINYSFGEELSSNNLSFTDKKSDYSQMITSVVNNNFNQNIGALIVAGDGIYNRGKNPVNLLDEVGFPIYTIGFGDTTVVSDARIQNVRTNRTAFSGNKFPVELDVLFSKIRNRALKLSIIHNNEELKSVMITPPNDNYFISKEFILEATEPGLQHYTAKIESNENERNTDNNTANFVINILENKQKILILSDGAHPDIGAIKNTLDQQKSYDVSVFTEEPYPNDLKDFNLLILNQLPTSGFSVAEIERKAASARIPVLYIVGSKTFIPQFNILAQGTEIKPLAGSGEEAQPVLNPNFASFKLSEDFKELLPKFPPLMVNFADYILDEGFTPLFYQKLKNIETGKPLMATGKSDGRKIGYIFGEGIWRWRLFDYYQNQSHQHFNEFINQLVQYLALRENEDNFIIDHQPVYAETDDVIFTAEVYNDAYEKVSGPEINIVLTNSNNEEFRFTFDVQGENYYLNTGHLPVGDYTFEAEVELGDKQFTEEGQFTIVAVNLENVVTRANHNTLYQLASLSGGEFFLPGNTRELIDELTSGNKLKAVSHYQEMINELLNLKGLFFVLLFLLSVEWFLRKYWGVY